MNYGEELRREIRSEGTTPLIGVFDMFSASVAAQHYNGLFVSGFGFAASHYGLPDIGFIAWPDIVAFVQRLRLAFPGRHLLVDIDDGYVDPEVACHVVEQLELIGASGVILEDQQRPRRCGHVDGKRILPLQEYLDKLDMVLRTRRDLVVVARTDAGEEDEVLARAEALARTDADVVLVDGVRSVEQIRRVRAVIGDKPLLFNQIAGGRSPRISLPELTELGVEVAIYSTPCLFAAQSAMEEAIVRLKRDDGRLPEHTAGSVGVRESLALLERNISRNHPRPELAAMFPDGGAFSRPAAAGHSRKTSMAATTTSITPQASA
ncbi:isocitrate lyase/PEP mutase family protein [Actinomadura sp. NPDC048032]|uniref:isocitrate lyase/PEP mutase family protein n=1 Tax=Actinomadura sp. NPDC048032 TaxID=3155747 RepID=UPI0033DD2B21